MIKHATTDTEIRACFPVLQELRPHLIESEFLCLVREMEKSGYRLVYSLDTAVQIAAVAGYRVDTNLFMGKHLYVNDLITKQAARSQQHGHALIQWLKQEAKRQQCNHLHLDSGTHRAQAHKFYFKEGFTIASFHFSQPIGASD